MERKHSHAIELTGSLQLPPIDRYVGLVKEGLVVTRLKRIDMGPGAPRLYFIAHIQAARSSDSAQFWFVQMIRTFDEQPEEEAAYEPNVSIVDVPWIEPMIMAAGEFINGQFLGTHYRCVSIEAVHHIAYDVEGFGAQRSETRHTWTIPYSSFEEGYYTANPGHRSDR